MLLLNKLDIGGGGNLANTNGIGWRDVLLALQNLTEVKPVAKLMSELRGWNPVKENEGGGLEVKAEEFEYRALWGPWLRLSSFPDGAVRPTVSLTSPEVVFERHRMYRLLYLKLIFLNLLRWVKETFNPLLPVYEVLSQVFRCVDVARLSL